jgi:hypothetical protein
MEVSKLLRLRVSLLRVTILLSIIISAGNAKAQAPENQGFTVNTQLSLLRDSNVGNSTNESADNLFKFAPYISFSNIIGKHRFSATYAGTFTKYSELSQFDYDNHLATIGIVFDHSTKLSTAFTVSYEDAIEEPGATNGLLAGANGFYQFSVSQMSAAVFYGTRASIGQFIVELDYNNVDFANTNQRFRNTATTNVTGSYFYRIAPNTRLLVELVNANFDYSDAESIDDQSRLQNTYSTGIEWTSSAQTTSIFKLGYQTRDFDNPAFSNTKDLAYSLDIIWQPKTYTQVTFRATRAGAESAIQGTVDTIRNTYSIDLQHELSSLLVLGSLIEYTEDDISIRTDTNTNFQLGLTYSVKHWLDISLSYVVENRQSDDSLFDYDSELIQLSFISTFD